MKLIFNLVILCSGLTLLLYGAYLVALRHRPVQLVQASTQIPQEVVTSLPTHLEIPSLALELPIYPAEIVGGRWQTTSEGISYLTSSPLPGDVGNSVMYGHNWPNLLGNLHNIQPGDTISVYFGSKRLDYVVHFVSVVSPAETSIYADTPDTRLTLYTCTGFLDSKRLVVTAQLAS